MSKKIFLLALAAVSVAAFGLPSMAAAEDIPLHLVPRPEGTKTIDGEGHVTWTGAFGSVTCTSSSGTAQFATSTTGTLEATLKGCTLGGASCTTSGQAAGVITSTQLEFHLLTVEHTPTTGTSGPGILITPPGTESVPFASFTCGFLGFTVKGNGLIGTINNPACGSSSNELTIQFSSSSTGVQTHKTVVGTATDYSLENLGAAASLDWSIIITLGTAAKLECT